VRAWLGPDRCTEEPIHASDLLRADEAFLTNAVSGIVPLVGVDGQVVGNGRPGPVTRELLEKHTAWRKAARRAPYHAP
jgi:branched-subunit amino acid aminotransferase/4-amino-4-deoxychorismate lyase